MPIRVVEAADGRRWTIRRRIAWPRFRFASNGLPPLELDPSGILLLLLLPLVLAAILVLLFSVALVAEAVVVLLAAYVWRGRWIIEATTEGDRSQTRTWEARSWRGSRRKLNDVAREIAR